MRIATIAVAVFALGACTPSGEAQMHKAGQEARAAADTAASAAKDSARAVTADAASKAGDALQKAGSDVKAQAHGAGGTSDHAKAESAKKRHG